LPKINKILSIQNANLILPADLDTILALTKRINGGTHGLADREEKTLKYHGWVKA
jgi:predicted chitinase